MSILVDLRIAGGRQRVSDGWHRWGADTFDLLSCAAARTVISD